MLRADTVGTYEAVIDVFRKHTGTKYSNNKTSALGALRAALEQVFPRAGA